MEKKTLNNDFELTPVLLSTYLRNLQPFGVKRNRSRSHQTHSLDRKFMARALRPWAINRRGKT